MTTRWCGAARLQLAGVLTDAKAYDDALKQLSGGFPKSFDALVADRRGDIHSLQGKKAEARAEYLKAYQGLDERAEYRRLVEIKLNALGVDPKPVVLATAPTAAPVAAVTAAPAAAPTPATPAVPGPAAAASAGAKP